MDRLRCSWQGYAKVCYIIPPVSPFAVHHAWEWTILSRLVESLGFYSELVFAIESVCNEGHRDTARAPWRQRDVITSDTDHMNHFINNWFQADLFFVRVIKWIDLPVEEHCLRLVHIFWSDLKLLNLSHFPSTAAIISNIIMIIWKLNIHEHSCNEYSLQDVCKHIRHTSLIKYTS